MNICERFAVYEREAAEKRAAKEAAKKIELDLAEQKLAEDYFNSFESKGSDPTTNTETKTEHVDQDVLVHDRAEAHLG